MLLNLVNPANGFDVQRVLQEIQSMGPNASMEACGLIPSLMSTFPDASNVLMQLQQAICFDVQDNNMNNDMNNSNNAVDMPADDSQNLT